MVGSDSSLRALRSNAVSAEQREQATVSPDVVASAPSVAASTERQRFADLRRSNERHARRERERTERDKRSIERALGLIHARAAERGRGRSSQRPSR